jgi:hypothetical protein
MKKSALWILTLALWAGLLCAQEMPAVLPFTLAAPLPGRWSPSGLGENSATEVAFNSRGEVLVATGAGVFRGSGAGPWEGLGLKTVSDPFSLAIGPDDTLYVGTTKHGLFRSRDGGKQWENVLAKKYHPFFIRHVVVDPKDPHHIVALRNPLRTIDESDTTDFPPIGEIFTSSRSGDPGSWRILFSQPNPIHALQAHVEHGIFFDGWFSPLFRISEKEKTIAVLPSSPEETLSLAFDPEGRLHAGGKFVYQWNAEKLRWTALGAAHWYDVFSDRFGQIYVVQNFEDHGQTRLGVFLLKNRNLVPLGGTLPWPAARNSCSNPFIFHVTADEKGVIYVASVKGLFLFHPGKP